jgi:gluconate kinase
MLERTNHFMPSSLLKSQFEILEIPENAVMFNIAEEPARIVERIMNSL